MVFQWFALACVNEGMAVAIARRQHVIIAAGGASVQNLRTPALRGCFAASEEYRISGVEFAILN